MSKQFSAGIMFGGTEVSAFVGYGSVNGSVVISRRASLEYSGLVGTEFVSPGELAAAAGAVLSEVIGESYAPEPEPAEADKPVKGKKNKSEQSLFSRIGRLVIGVPPQFCKVAVREASLEFSKPAKIGAREVAKLLDSVETEPVEDYSIISRSAVYFKADDGHPVIDAAGIVASKISAQVSVVWVSDNFIRIAAECVGARWLSLLSFVPVVLAEANYFIEDEARDSTCVLVSCGMFSTCAAVCSGDSLVQIRTVEVGLGHFVNDVATVLGVSFYTAKLLVDEAVLSVAMGQNDNYQINLGGGKTQKFAAAKVNDIIKSRLALLSQRLREVIKKSAGEQAFSKEFFICGGYLDAVAGARNFLSKALGVRVKRAVCPFTGQSKPEFSEKALLKQAVRHVGTV